MASRAIIVIGWLGLGACALDAAGEGVALPGAELPSTSDAAIDGLAPDAPVTPCADCTGENVTVEETFDTDTVVDGAGSANVRIAEGAAMLASALDPGTGADGPCTLNAITINITAASCSNRSAPDAPVSFLVSDVAAGEDTLPIANPLTGLAVGDEVLIIDTQTTSAIAVGSFETRRVTAVTATTVTVTPALANAHLAVDRVNVQRIPNYSSVTIPGGARLVAQAWNGLTGGVFAMRVKGKVDVAGSIDVSLAGYRGGPRPPPSNNEDGFAGETFFGGFQSSRSNAPNGGGGGAGRGDPCGGRGVGGGGGAHLSVGGSAGDATCGGFGGMPYGGVGRLTMGSGGGSGGNDNTLATSPYGGIGGPGAGAMLIEAESVAVSGVLAAHGGVGGGDAAPCTSTSSSTTMCWDFSGPGGGGAGGTIHVRARSITANANAIAARGGAAGIGYNNLAGAGALGRIVLSGDEVSAVSTPAAAAEPLYPTSGRVSSKDLLVGRPSASSFKSLAIDVKARPDNTKVRVLVSVDGVAWTPAMPPGVDTLPVGITSVPLESVLGASASFFYRIQFDGAGYQTAVVDRVTLVYVH